MNSLYPFMEKQDEQEGEETNLKLYIFSSSSQVVAAASSSASSSSQLAFATCFSTNATQHDHQRVNLHHHLLQESHHQLQHDYHQAEKSIDGSRENSEAEVILSSNSNLVKSSTREALERSRSRSDIDDHQEQQLDNPNGSSAAKYWMSSKMRLMQKMMINKTDKKVIGGANSDDHKAATRNIINNNNQGSDGGKIWEIRGRTSCNSNGHNNNNIINGVRVCSDCNTTTTPLWRSGPQGPKSLCNACGIRQRKARRAMAEAANGGGGGGGDTVVVGSGKEVHKEKKSRLSCDGDGSIVGDHVKKNKYWNKNMTENSSDSQSEGPNDGVSFDRHNFTLRLSKSGSTFGRVFPKDEEEAAILLMELSCGLVHTC